MSWKRMLAIAVALTAPVIAAPARATASIYVGTGNGYFVALEIKNGHPYILALTARTYCRGTGAHRSEHLGSGPWEMFSTPARMQETRQGFRGSDELDSPFWREYAVVQAKFRHRGAVVGTFTMSTEEPESECWTGGYRGDPKVAFAAHRYVPVSSHGASSRALRRGAGGIYFAKAGKVETLIRRLRGKTLEIRGIVRQRCPIPASEKDPPPVPMLGSVEAQQLVSHGAFREHRRFHGATPHRGTYSERMSMTGRIKPGVLLGRYHRVKVRKRGERVIRRCETGARFRAKRYVRAR